MKQKKMSERTKNPKMREYYTRPKETTDDREKQKQGLLQNLSRSPRDHTISFHPLKDPGREWNGTSKQVSSSTIWRQMETDKTQENQGIGAKNKTMPSLTTKQ